MLTSTLLLIHDLIRMNNVQILYCVITHFVWLSQLVINKEFNSNTDAEVTLGQMTIEIPNPSVLKEIPSLCITHIWIYEGFQVLF